MKKYYLLVFCFKLEISFQLEKNMQYGDKYEMKL